jgi:hypothetical protein
MLQKNVTGRFDTLAVREQGRDKVRHIYQYMSAEK